jgi:hypothetical protein
MRLTMMGWSFLLSPAMACSGHPGESRDPREPPADGVDPGLRRDDTRQEAHFFPFTWLSSSAKVGRSPEYSTLRPNSTATCGA